MYVTCQKAPHVRAFRAVILSLQRLPSLSWPALLRGLVLPVFHFTLPLLPYLLPDPERHCGLFPFDVSRCASGIPVLVGRPARSLCAVHSLSHVARSLRLPFNPSHVNNYIRPNSKVKRGDTFRRVRLLSSRCRATGAPSAPAVLRETTPFLRRDRYRLLENS